MRVVMLLLFFAIALVAVNAIASTESRLHVVHAVCGAVARHAFTEGVPMSGTYAIQRFVLTLGNGCVPLLSM